jgi:hypothetical protein
MIFGVVFKVTFVETLVDLGVSLHLTLAKEDGLRAASS